MFNASIVTYHTPSEQLQCIRSLLEQSPLLHQLEVIDNGGGHNRGYGAAHNIAIRHTIEQQVPYHLVVNADIRFDNGVLEQLIDYMDANHDVGCVMPRVVYPDGRIQYLCKLLPTPLDVFGRRFLPKKWMAKRNKRYQLEESGYNQEMNIPYLSGCFMLLRTSALEQVGLFDERFFLYPEDIDLTRRIHRHFRTMFYPRCTIVHDHAQGSYKSTRLLVIHIVNLCRYFNKWGWLIDHERTLFNRQCLQSITPPC